MKFWPLFYLLLAALCIGNVAYSERADLGWATAALFAFTLAVEAWKRRAGA